MSWDVANCLDQLLAEINASAPNRNKASDGSIGDADHSASTSDHNPCDCHDKVCARDFTHDPAGGFDSYHFAHWLADRTKGPEARVKYIISNGQIASGQGQSYPAGQWRNYTGSNPHDHHVHVSVRHGSEHFDNADGWRWADGGEPEPAPDERPEPMWCLVRGPNGSIYRINGATKQHIPDAKMVGGDQIILSWLGLESDYADVAQDWLDTWKDA